MFCKKCGYQIKEGLLFCPNCGEKAVSSAPNQRIEPKPQGRSLKKCAWYAPVSVIVVLLVINIVNTAINGILNIDYKDGSISLYNEHIYTFVLSLIMSVTTIVSAIAIPIAFFYLATVNQKKEIKNHMFFSVFISTSFSFILYRSISVSSSAALISVGLYILLGAVSVILATVLSYFITAKYFEKEEKKIFSEMLQE